MKKVIQILFLLLYFSALAQEKKDSLNLNYILELKGGIIFKSLFLKPAPQNPTGPNAFYYTKELPDLLPHGYVLGLSSKIRITENNEKLFGRFDVNYFEVHGDSSYYSYYGNIYTGNIKNVFMKYNKFLSTSISFNYLKEINKFYFTASLGIEYFSQIFSKVSTDLYQTFPNNPQYYYHAHNIYSDKKNYFNPTPIPFFNLNVRYSLNKKKSFPQIEIKESLLFQSLSSGISYSHYKNKETKDTIQYLKTQNNSFVHNDSIIKESKWSIGGYGGVNSSINKFVSDMHPGSGFSAGIDIKKNLNERFHFVTGVILDRFSFHTGIINTSYILGSDYIIYYNHYFLSTPILLQYCPSKKGKWNIDFSTGTQVSFLRKLNSRVHYDRLDTMVTINYSDREMMGFLSFSMNILYKPNDKISLYARPFYKSSFQFHQSSYISYGLCTGIDYSFYSKKKIKIDTTLVKRKSIRKYTGMFGFFVEQSISCNSGKKYVPYRFSDVGTSGWYYYEEYSNIKESPIIGFSTGLEIIPIIFKSFAIKTGIIFERFKYKGTASVHYHSININNNPPTITDTYCTECHDYSFTEDFFHFPLSINYYFGYKPKRALFLELGATASIWANEDYSGGYFYNTINNNTLDLFSVAGIGYNKIISEHSVFSVEPIFRYNIISQDERHFYSGGIKAGLMLR